MQEIREVLKEVIRETYGIDFEPEITIAPENIDADYSTNAPLKLAREVHKAPMEICEKLIHELEKVLSRNAPSGPSLRASVAPYFPRRKICSSKVLFSSSSPGFINFKLADEYLANEIDELVDGFNEKVRGNKFNEKTVICEFSDPNPFKVLHVGHLYTSVVGDAISRLFEYAGAKVVRANFGGDVGLHVAKTMYALLKKDFDKLTIEDIAKCYVEGTADYEDNDEAKAEIIRLNKEIYHINAEDMHDSDLAKLYWKGRELSYEYFDKFYGSIGVKFDKYYPESTVAALGLRKVKEQLELGVYKISDGAVVFDGEKFGLHTRVFINQEGVPTYETKDVGLIFTKWQDYHFDKSVVITGSEQLDYMRVVLKSVEQYAPELVKKTSHLTHGLVKLPGNEKMSSRKGNFLKAVDVLEMVRNELKNEYNSSDEKVVLAALKYAFLKYKMGGNIIFDPKESVKMTGNSGPYLLYSAVRAKKILSKAGALSDVSFSGSAGSSSKKTLSVTPAERNLMKKLIEYIDILNEAVEEMVPHKLANYLYELAQVFSRFYESCQVTGSEQEVERLKLVSAYLKTMTHGLNILGIEIPEEM